jgi:hypothetical protein
MRRWQLQNDMWILALWWRREVCLVHHWIEQELSILLYSSYTIIVQLLNE